MALGGSSGSYCDCRQTGSRGALMQSVWTLAGLGMLAAITVPFRWWMRRMRHSDLGSVSQQWLAENRHSQSHAERR
jgi:hypothetical protein